MHKTQSADELAIERTRLANERTLLAYVRTALALAAAGAVLIEFFPSHFLLSGIAWALIVSGMSCMGLGIYRFTVVAGRLRTDGE